MPINFKHFTADISINLLFSYVMLVNSVHVNA